VYATAMKTAYDSGKVTLFDCSRSKLGDFYSMFFGIFFRADENSGI
jgi:hypothetical protein